MKKILAIGIVSGVVVYFALSTYTRQVEKSLRRLKNRNSDSGKNETEGYFYHQTQALPE
ncbi:hypothetical protein [Dyadobacter sediminis]|uniref:hypothetical protein n=1 Tax=Dyadobacter sediminis TaxID=1493691 RepID=UPI001486D2A6|nr:hypothetical protein [Dyadobacter sediminis]GGB78493.1 hypothetical protein GCM10011325_02500 [Dyadobacter sediminis]